MAAAVRLAEWRRSEAAGQLVRFAVAGGLTTALYTAVYSPLAGFGWTSEQVANFAGYVVAVISGYLLHSRWSFRGHGGRVQRTSWRFVVVSLVSYGANTFWVWLLTDDAMLAGPWWWPLLPVLFVTPIATFALNRFWVFRRTSEN